MPGRSPVGLSFNQPMFFPLTLTAKPLVIIIYRVLHFVNSTGSFAPEVRNLPDLETVKRFHWPCLVVLLLAFRSTSPCFFPLTVTAKPLVIIIYRVLHSVNSTAISLAMPSRSPVGLSFNQLMFFPLTLTAKPLVIIIYRVLHSVNSTGSIAPEARN